MMTDELSGRRFSTNNMVSLWCDVWKNCKSHVSFTSDAWSSGRFDSYLAVIAHYFGGTSLEEGYLVHAPLTCGFSSHSGCKITCWWRPRCHLFQQVGEIGVTRQSKNIIIGSRWELNPAPLIWPPELPSKAWSLRAKFCDFYQTFLSDFDTDQRSGIDPPLAGDSTRRPRTVKRTNKRSLTTK